jgi:hypothetical protein
MSEGWIQDSFPLPLEEVKGERPFPQCLDMPIDEEEDEDEFRINEVYTEHSRVTELRNFNQMKNLNVELALESDQ